MQTSALLALALTCAPQVHADTTQALVHVESAANPWAIGVVGGALERQPRHRTEAVVTARTLQRAGWDFSIGLAQINVRNFERLGLTIESALDPCTNLSAAQTILVECYGRAHRSDHRWATDQVALRRALSCYYSGNFASGFRHGYVRKVATAVRMETSTSSVPLKDKP